MQDGDWGTDGRWYAWAYGALALVGGVTAAVVSAGMLGILWMLLQIGSAQAVVRDTPGANAQDLAAIGAASSIWSAVINWMERGFLIFAGAASYWTGRAALDQRIFSRGLGWFSLVVAALYLLGFAVLAFRDAGVFLLDAVGSLLFALWAVSADVCEGLGGVV